MAKPLLSGSGSSNTGHKTLGAVQANPPEWTKQHCLLPWQPDLIT